MPIIDEVRFLARKPHPQPCNRMSPFIWLLHSSDEGATWSAPTDITNDRMGPGTFVFSMQNGRLVAPVYDGVIFGCDDHGKTWKSGRKNTRAWTASRRRSS